MSRSQRLAALAAVGPALLVLAACTAGPTTPAPTPVDFPDPVALTGFGTQEIVLDIPEGAQSLQMRLACTSTSYFRVSAGGPMEQDRSGTCGDLTVITLPLPTGPRVHAFVDVSPDASVAAELTFSREPLGVDAPVAADCEALSAFFSATMNADDGYAREALDLEGWQAKVDEAAAALEGMDPTPLIAPQVDVLSAWLEGIAEPGHFLAATSAQVAGARELAHQICAANGTQIIIMADYGG